jgi:hypothetical protein
LLGGLAVAVVVGVLSLGSGASPELDLLPPQAVLRDGERIQITAAVTGSVGEAAREAGFQWTSSNPSVATVDAEGVVTGVGEGTAAIVARIGELAASADITVQDARSSATESGGEAEALPTGGGARDGAGSPALRLARARLSFTSLAGQGEVEPAFVEVTGAGITDLGLEVTYPSGGSSGWLTAGLSGSSAPTRIELRVDPAAVPAGEHEARVDVTAAGSPGASLRVSYLKAPAGPEEADAGLPLDELDEVLDRQVNRLLDGPGPEALSAVRDTAEAVWALQGQAPTASRAQAAFVAAQAEVLAGNVEEALTWAERAVALAPDNEGYRRLLEDLGGGTP